jgi:hypothetical protein
VEAYPLLIYFGASYAADAKRGLLAIVMPQVTFSESLLYWAQTGQNLATYTVKGTTFGIDNASAQVFLSQATLLAAGKLVLPTDVVYQALELDTSTYSSVKDARTARTQQVNDAFTRLSDEIDLGSDFADIAAFVNQSEVLKPLLAQTENAMDSGALTSALDTFSQATKSQGTYTAAVESVNGTVDALLLGLDTFVTASQRDGIGNLVKKAFSNTFSKSTASLANQADLNGEYLRNARQVTNELSSSSATDQAAFFEKALEFVAQQVAAKTVEIIAGSLPALCYELGTALANLISQFPIGKYTPFAEIPKAQSSYSAIYSAGYYQQAKAIFYGILDKLAADGFRDAAAMAQWRDAYIVMLRFMLLNYESHITYAQQSDYYNKYEKQIAAFQHAADGIAKALDDAENSAAAPLASLSDLSKGDADFRSQVTTAANIDSWACARKPPRSCDAGFEGKL